MGNLKLIIVDDESFSADSLARIVKLLDLNIDVVATFYSAEKALEFLKTEMIDMIITDIKMPEMDGLTFVSEVRKNNSDIQFIILTGYGTLEYAMDAMRYSVKYFLEKPITKKKLEKNLESCMVDCSLVRERKILEWKKNLDNLLVDQSQKLVVKIPRFSIFIYDNKNYPGSKLILESVLSDSKGLFSVSILGDYVVYYVFYQKIQNYSNQLEKLVTNEESLIYYSYEISPKQLPKILELARNEIQKSIFYEEKGVFPLENPLHQNQINVYEKYCEIEKIIKMNDFTQSQEKISELFDLIKKNRLEMNKVKKESAKFGEMLLEGNDNLEDNERVQIINQLLTREKFKELSELIIRLLRQCSESFKQVSLTNTLGGNINGLIEKHYDSPNFSLRWISKNIIFLNAEYMGKAYYKETGIKFSQKLIDVRLKKSVIFLKEGYKVYEVATMVGYENSPDYFIQVFKKKYGCTPRQYIKKNQ